MLSRMTAGLTDNRTASRDTHAVPYTVPIVCFVVAMIDGYDTLMLSFIAPLITKQWALSAQTVGAIFASTYAGAALGAASLGVAADRFGRKRLLLASLLLAGICTFCSAWSGGPLSLMGWRAGAGIGLGGAIPAITALTAAAVSPARRSTAVGRMFLGYPVGAMAGGMVTAGIMSRVGWRGVLMAGGICAFLLVPLAVALVRESGAGDARARAKVHSVHPIAELIAGRLWGTILVCTATFLTLLVSYFLVSWTPTVLALNGANPQRAALMGAVLNLGGLGGAWMLSSLIARFSPSLTIGASLGVGALMIALLGQAIAAPTAVLFIFVLAVGMLVIGAQSNIPALCVHYYPASVYSAGVGLAMAVGRLGSIVGPLLGGRLMAARISWSLLFVLAAVPALMGAVALAAMPIKGRRR
jgi:AAHS family 4-hydroxybenzoate transporter-like MFS transporter